MSLAAADGEISNQRFVRPTSVTFGDGAVTSKRFFAKLTPCRMLLAFVISTKSRLKLAAAGAALLFLAMPLLAAPPAIQIPRIETAPRLADFEGMHPVARVG